MKGQTVKIECPECGCREIHREYENPGYGLFSGFHDMADEGIPVEPGWCYCMGCGIMFDPVQEAFVV